jgi:LysM repeat protein
MILLIPETIQNEGALATATTTTALPGSETTASTAPGDTQSVHNGLMAWFQAATQDNRTPAASASTSNTPIAQPNLSAATVLDSGARAVVTRENNAGEEGTSDRTASRETFQRVRIHIVRHGETLYSIAHRYGVSESTLAAWNHLSVHRPLHTGQRLRVEEGSHLSHREGENTATQATRPTSTVTSHASHREANPRAESKTVRSSESHEAAASTTRHRIHYRIRPGDTLERIARQHHVSVAQLRAWNGSAARRLHPGHTLIIEETRPA